ncbi:anti-sigma factor family protein [Streptomyces sp. NPDC056937]|uniref:anti-sigma factor family protein n=2 Tax=Streptomyces TaxID=1883 RepID=UPI0036380F02
MTSTTDTAQHPDVSEISDLAEGLLSPSRSAAVRSHLDGCALCADVHDSLEEIRGLLGTLPGPPRMPADVAERIDAALAAEALLDATAPDENGDVSRETSPSPRTSSPPTPATPSLAIPTGPPAPTESPSADSGRTDRPAGRPRAATGPGRGGHLRRRRRNAVLGAVFGTAAVGVSVLLIQSLGVSNSTSGSKADSAVSAPRNGKEFSEAHLQSRVDALLDPGAPVKESKGSRAEEPRDAGGDRSTANSPLLQPEPEIPPCVRQGTGSTAPALAAEPGTYRGSSAYLVVLPHATDSTQVQAYVIDAACVDSDPSGKGKVLLEHAYLRR